MFFVRNASFFSFQSADDSRRVVGFENRASRDDRIRARFNQFLRRALVDAAVDLHSRRGTEILSHTSHAFDFFVQRLVRRGSQAWVYQHDDDDVAIRTEFFDRI